MVTYHITALVERLEGRWQSPILSEEYHDIEDVIKAVKQTAIRGADSIIIKISREGDK